MKRLLTICVLLSMVSAAQALIFHIGPAPGYTEPLSSGDVIEISASSPHTPGHQFAYSRWRMYYNNIFLGEVDIPGWPFDIDANGVVSGSAVFDAGPYADANKVELYIATTYPPTIYHWTSENLLNVEATAPYVPSTGAVGLIVLLLGLSFLIYSRNR